MFGIKNLKDLDMMTVSLIIVAVILMLYLIRRSTMYSSRLIEGNTLRNKSQQNDTKYKFATAIENWEKSSIKYQASDVSNIKSLASAIMNDLNYNGTDSKGERNSTNYKEMMVDLEDIANSFSVILCVDMAKQLNKMGTQTDTERQASSEILFDFLANASFINSLQEFKRNLGDIHSWNPMPMSSLSSSNSSSMFGGSKKSSSKSNSKSSSSSSLF